MDFEYCWRSYLLISYVFSFLFWYGGDFIAVYILNFDDEKSLNEHHLVSIICEHLFLQA